MVKNIPSLTSREREILRFVVHHFVLTANPVGSRQLSRKFGLNLSPATIRNVMADLEEMGLLSHPHTSAGRVPSDLGYRMYVNDLMDASELTVEERDAIEHEFEGASKEVDEIMAVTAKVLSSASQLLSVVMAPSTDEGQLQKIELVRLSENRVLVVISIQAGPMKTIMVELEQSLRETQLKEVSDFLNRRLSGLTLAKVRAEIGDRLKNMPSIHPHLVRFIVDSADKLFKFNDKEDIKIGGRAQVISQPEFNDPQSMRGIIELIENKDIIVHLVQNQKNDSPVTVSIGSENLDMRAKGLSILTSHYQSSVFDGTIGVIGPTRMDYSKVMSLLDFITKTVNSRL